MNTTPIWLRRFSKFTVFSTIILIFAGALVKSHEVGLSVPDWPTTYGYNMFTFPIENMVGGIFYEHSHRLIASFVGLLSIILAVWMGITEKRNWVKKIGYFAVGLVIIQGLFGGLTVLFFLPTAISMAHGIIAQLFLLLLTLIAYVFSAEYNSEISIKHSKNHSSILKWSRITLSVIFVQLIFGAWMRHLNAGLAIPDFPTVGWTWLPMINDDILQRINEWRFDYDLPLISSFPAWVHLLHRVWAMVVTISIFIFGHYYFRGNRDYNFTMILLHVGIISQLMFGAFTIWSGKAPIITSFHVVNGAILLALSFLMVLRYSNRLNLLRREAG